MRHHSSSDVYRDPTYVLASLLDLSGMQASVRRYGSRGGDASRAVIEMHQLLLRAAICRLVTTATAFPEDSDRLEQEFEANRPVLDLIDAYAEGA